MPGGRPTKYNAKMLKAAVDYIKNHEKVGDPVPTAAGLACELGVSKATIYNWAEDHPEFLDTLGVLNGMQERLLTGKGITGEFNSTITKLMLSNHGYSEKSENVNTVQGPGGGSLEISFVGVCRTDDSK